MIYELRYILADSSAFLILLSYLCTLYGMKEVAFSIVTSIMFRESSFTVILKV